MAAIVYPSTSGTLALLSDITAGTSGTSGIDGTSGINGVNGTSGINGANGTSGSSGTSVSVSGTLNYVSKFTGTGTTIGNSLIFDNGTNVGIGTTSPANLLDVVKAGTNAISVQNTANTSDAYYIAQNTAGSAFFGINATGPYVYTLAALNFHVITNNVERLRVTSAGNVLISTTTSAASVLKFQVGDGTTDARAYFNPSSQYALAVANSSSNAYYIGVGTSGTTSSFVLHNASAGTNPFTIAYTGAATFTSSVTASSFSGAGTGLTGTASSLTSGSSNALAGYASSSYLNKNGTSYYQATTWIELTGVHGLYCPSVNGAHFYPNNASSYATWALAGSRGGYGGIYDSYSLMAMMHDSGGSGGFYREASSKWTIYWSSANNSVGINGSTTLNWAAAVTNGTMFYTSESYATYNMFAVAFVPTSDIRLKENFAPLENSLDKIKQLEGVSYNRIEDIEKKREIGFIAQHVQEIIPEIVKYHEDTDTYGVDYDKITALLTEALKEEDSKVEALNTKIAALEAKIQELETRIANL
jgi:hypothetical protein